MATKKATKKSTNRRASKTGSKKSYAAGRKGSKAGGDPVPGEPIIVGGGGGMEEDGLPFIRFPNVFQEVSSQGNKDFYKPGTRITRVRVTGDNIKEYDQSPDGECQVEIWFTEP